jgi:hypothetical protein
MPVGRRNRFDAVRPRIVELFGADAVERVEQVLTLMEMAWHDCYGQVAPPQTVLDNILACSGGTLDGLVDAAYLAVIDSRDLAIRASALG